MDCICELYCYNTNNTAYVDTHIYIYIYTSYDTYTCFSPHLCVGFLFLILYPAPPPPPPPPCQLSYTIFHTQLCHTPLCHIPLCHTQLCHTHHLSHTTLSNTTLSHTHNFVAHHLSRGVALGDIDLCFTWQAWHCWHWAGSGGALGPRWSHGAPRHFAWQVWHLATSTFVVSSGRPGTWRHSPLFYLHPKCFCSCSFDLASFSCISLYMCSCIYRADRRIVGCHLVSRGCGMTWSYVLGANAWSARAMG